MTQITEQLCVYCGSAAGNTKDHVPPKAFFPKPRPSNLITVPSCPTCNQSASKDEELFLATLLFSDAGVTTIGRQLWKEKMSRAYSRPQGIAKIIARMLRQAHIRTPVGIYLGKRMALDIDYDRLYRVVSKIVRGLYYYEYKEALGKDVEITCQWLNTHSTQATAHKHIEILPFAQKSFPGVFSYRFSRVVEKPQRSEWAILFFNHTVFWAITYA